MYGIIFRQSKVRDNDAITDWLTDSDTTLTAVASHIQGSKSFPNGLETMCVYEMTCDRRKSGDMWRLETAYSARRFDGLLQNIASYACASAALEAVANVCPTDSAIDGLFESLLSSLAVMNTAPEYSAMVLAWFECHLFSQIGALPNIDYCAQCAKPLRRSKWFQQEVGFLCEGCAHGEENIAPIVLESVRRLRQQSLRQTMQNVVERGASIEKLNSVLDHVLRFLFAIMSDNSAIRRTKAHVFMRDAVFGASIE